MAAKRGGLGKGLDSLIPEGKKPVSSSKPAVKEVVKEVVKTVEQKVKITKIEPNREQPRKIFEEDALLELADSIKQFGVLQPLLVQKKGDYYEIIAGERRWRAAKLAGLKEVPVIIKDYTEKEIVEIALIENIQRENLNPIEEAVAYKRLSSEFGLKQDEIAERVSKSRQAVANSMRLLKLGEKIQEMVISGEISAGHARALLAVEDAEAQYELALRISAENLSVRDIENIINQMKKAPKVDKKQVRGNEFLYRDLEEKMISVIGTKVSINQKGKGKGKIEIEYYSQDELERIYDLIMSTKQD